MTFSDVQSKTVISGFSAGDRTIILNALRTAYDTSSIAKAMFDDWIADPAHRITINNVPNVFQARTGTGVVEIDLNYISDLSYIGSTGTAVLHSPIGAIIHELGHALHGTRDSISDTDYQGDNVRYVNTIWAQLGIPKEISYIAQARNNLHRVGYQYTNGAAIDAAHTGDTNFNSSRLGVSKDLLIGGSSANMLESGQGDDFLVGAGGNDILNGGQGIDTAVYFDKALDYDIRKNADGSWSVKHARGLANEGADALANIEKIQLDGVQYELKDHGLKFQTDFALVIDTTGSMASSIDSVKAQASSLINAAFADGKADARIGVVGFKDTTNGEPSSVILPFTDQDSFEARKSAAIAAINGITVGGGGDIPETALDGLRVALDGHMGQWRAGAGILRVALFTDAPAKDGALAASVTSLAHSIGATITSSLSAKGTGGTVDTFSLSFGSSAQEADGLFGSDDPSANPEFPYVPSNDPIATNVTTQVQIFTIFTGGDGGDTGVLGDIAAANGGALLNAPTNDDLVRVLLEIINAPPPVTVSIAATSADKFEGGAGATTAFTFTITRSGDLSVSGSVDYIVAATGAKPVAANDFVGGAFPSGTATFAAGEASKVVTINVAGDTVIEDDETFAVNLVNPSSGTVVNAASAIGTIRNDEFPTNLAIAPTSAVKVEGAAGATTAFTFTVTRSGDTAAASSATWRVTGIGASPADASDFTGGTLPTGTVSFAAGQTSKVITVNVAGDNVSEANEGFRVLLSAPSAGTTITTASANATVTNDDVNLVSVAPITISEATTGTTNAVFTVRLAAPSSTDVTIAYTTANGTAVAGSDFTRVSGTLTIAAGQSTGTITVPILADSTVDGGENFNLVLSAPTGGAGFPGGTPTLTAVGTIQDPPTATPPSLAIAAPSADKFEGASSTTPFTFTVTRAGDTSGASSATWKVTGITGTPADATDFGGVLPTGTVSFAAGETSKLVTVNVRGDRTLEGNDVFRVTLSAPTAGTTIATATATGIIRNDDAQLAIAATSADKVEGDAGTTACTFTVTRTGNTTLSHSATWAVTGNGTSAADAADFSGGVFASGTVDFAAGQLTKVITVNVAGDTAFESDEGFRVTLGSPSNNATLLTSAANGIIRNDDVRPILGTEGDDTLNGTASNDRIEGLGGRDIIDGGAGNDLIIGGVGPDRLTGGAGGDRFVYTALSESTPALAGRDTILDFSSVQGDKIDLSAIDARTDQAGNQAFIFVADDFTGTPGELSIIRWSTFSTVQLDVNGDGVADFMVNVVGTIGATDFIL